VLFVAIVILVGTAITYWLGGDFALDPKASPPLTGHPEIQDAIYYSLVPFVALGYGSWTLEPLGWTRWVGAVESVLGIFSVVFFSITFAQRITR
jgi:drug/metabolite transporter (DMT)-like permease